MKKRIIIGLALILGVVTFGMAQTHTSRINKRQKNQPDHIGKDVSSDQLTSPEVASLERSAAKIPEDKQTTKPDHQLTKQERRRLNREQNRNNHRFYNDKHSDWHKGY